ncbi:MAG: hypothetical protein IBX63_10575 [Coriobacteriia bacterium]|nr:hypothetical protein [Coriobacteriia bacterium]
MQNATDAADSNGATSHGRRRLYWSSVAGILVVHLLLALEVVVRHDLPFGQINASAALIGVALCLVAVLTVTVLSDRMKRLAQQLEEANWLGSLEYFVLVPLPVILALIAVLSPTLIYKTPVAALVLASAIVWPDQLRTLHTWLRGDTGGDP